MIEPKKSVYTILSALDGVNVYQARPEQVIEYPCITFFVSNNSPTYVLEKEIGYQEMEVTIDIYAKTSSESGELLSTLEQAMISNGYRLTYCSDVPNDDASHLTTVFNIIG